MAAHHSHPTEPSKAQADVSIPSDQRQIEADVKQFASLDAGHLPPESSSSFLPWLMVGLLFLAGLGTFGYALYSSGLFHPSVSESVSSLTPTPTTSVSSSTLSPTPTSTQAQLTISILNGSGTPGKAAEVKAHLETFGYTHITTGNAASYTYRTGVLSAKNPATPLISKLLLDLQQHYSASLSAQPLDSSAPADIEFIVGAN